VEEYFFLLSLALPSSFYHVSALACTRSAKGARDEDQMALKWPKDGLFPAKKARPISL
jgi:hypothetical protein